VQTNDITMQSDGLYVSMDAIRRADRRVSLAVPALALGGSLRRAAEGSILSKLFFDFVE
jgi:hypothetical protein